MLSLETFGFIGSDYAKKLQTVGIRTPDDLIRMWGNEPNRTSLVHKTGISENVLDGWFRLFTNMRTRGIPYEYAELLDKVESNSIETLFELEPATLHAKLEEVKKRGEYKGNLPTLDQVRAWVESTREHAVN